MEIADACDAGLDAQMQSPQSVGQVKSQCLAFDESLTLASGQILPRYELMVETYGTLNSAHSNAILICHALTGNQHVAGYYQDSSEKPGWWDAFVGPGKPIDTERFFVVCLNNLGGCSGSSGPLTVNPETGVAYGPDFPMVTVTDWVNSQARLADRLGIACWAAVIGGSLGGMQSLEWSIRYPSRIKHAVIIASAPKLSSQNIAFNEVARQCIVRDPEFYEGHYLSYKAYPKDGLTQARMLGHITYLSDAGMQSKFGRNTATDKLQYAFNPEFEVERYLHYQGERFCSRFDANTYLLMTKALDYFDPAAAYEQDLAKALMATQSSFLVLSFSSDWRFSPKQSVELVDALIASGKRVTYACIESDAGHDAFLLPIPRYVELLRAYLKGVADSVAVDQ